MLVEVKKQQEIVEKVERILQVLSSFEESAAACISEMLSHFTNDAFKSGAIYAKRLIAHVELLFQILEQIDDRLALNFHDPQALSKSKEPRQLVKKIILFFQLLSNKKEDTSNATKDIIKLVTILAHVLKITIRHALVGALRLVRNRLDTKNN